MSHENGEETIGPAQRGHWSSLIEAPACFVQPAAPTTPCVPCVGEGRESASTTPSRTTHPTGMLGGSRQRHATIGGEERRGLHGSGSGTRAGCTASTANRRLHPRNHRGVHMPSRRRHGAGEVGGAGYMRGSVGGVEQAAPLFNGAPYSRGARLGLRRPGAVARAVRLRPPVAGTAKPTAHGALVRRNSNLLRSTTR